MINQKHITTGIINFRQQSNNSYSNNPQRDHSNYNNYNPMRPDMNVYNSHNNNFIRNNNNDMINNSRMDMQSNVSNKIEPRTMKSNKSHKKLNRSNNASRRDLNQEGIK